MMGGFAALSGPAETSGNPAPLDSMLEASPSESRREAAPGRQGPSLHAAVPGRPGRHGLSLAPGI